MKLTAEADLRLAPRRAWAELTDFDGFEKLLRDRGAELTRSATPDPPAVGTTWTGAFDYSGTRRDVAAELVALEPEQRMALALQSSGLEGLAELRLAQRGPRLCRVDLVLDLKARTWRGKLMLQPLKLAHATLEARLSARLQKIAAAMEARQKKRRARTGGGGTV